MRRFKASSESLHHENSLLSPLLRQGAKKSKVWFTHKTVVVFLTKLILAILVNSNQRVNVRGQTKHKSVLSYTLSGIRVQTLELSPPVVLIIMAARAMDENAEVFDEEPTDVVYMGSPRFEKVYKTTLRSSGLNYLLTDISCN